MGKESSAASGGLQAPMTPPHTEGLKELIEKLEKANGSDWQLSKEIGDLLGMEQRYEHPGSENPSHLHYTCSIDAALKLVPENHWWTLDGEDVDDAGEVVGPGALVAHYSVRDVRMRVSAATPAIALCIAALKSRAALGEKAS